MSDGTAGNEEQTMKPVLSVRDLKVAFNVDKKLKEVVHGVNFDVYPGETVAIVGESGSGKSTTMHAVMNLLPGTGRITEGSINVAGARARWHWSARDGDDSRPRDWSRAAGPDVEPQPRVVGRVPGRRGDSREWPRVEQEGRACARDRGARAGRSERRREAHEAVPAPVLWRHEAARAYRHRALCEAGAAHRRRADERARRDRAAGGPRPPCEAHERARHRRASSSRTTSASPPSEPRSSS